MKTFISAHMPPLIVPFLDLPDVIPNSYFSSFEQVRLQLPDKKMAFHRIADRFKNGEMWPKDSPDEATNYLHALRRFEQHLNLAKNSKTGLRQAIENWETLEIERKQNVAALVKQLYRDATDVYDRWARALTENFSATILGQEHLTNLTYEAIKNNEELPYSVCITRDITAWNKLAGHAACDILKAAVFAVIEENIGAYPGRICNMRRTNIGLQLSSADFERHSKFLQRLPELLPELIENELKFWATSPASQYQGKLKLTHEGRVEVLGEKGNWIPFKEFSNKFYIGVSQVELPPLETPLQNFYNRVAIHNATMHARNQAISRAETLTKVPDGPSYAGHNPFLLPPSHFEFAQGVYVEPQDVYKSLVALVGEKMPLVADFLVEMGISDGENLSYMLSWLRGTTKKQNDWNDAPKPLKKICEDFQQRLDIPTNEVLSRFALQAGFIPRPQHELGFFSHHTGPLFALSEIVKKIHLWQNGIMEEECNVPFYLGQLESLLPILEKLHDKADRARFELTNSRAIKKEYFEEQALHLMRQDPHTKTFHCLAIDVDHLYSFFTRYPLLVDQLVDFNMIRLQRLAHVALDRYAKSLGVADEIPAALLKFGDEIIFLFPDTTVDASGRTITLDRKVFESILHRELDDAFGKMDFQIHSKVELNHDVKRLPQYDLTLKNGKSVPVYVQDITLKDGTQERIYWMKTSDDTGDEAWVSMRHMNLDANNVESFKPAMGKLGFTIAATLYEFNGDQLWEITMEELRYIRETLLDHTDTMKKRGGRGQSEELELLPSLISDSAPCSYFLVTDPKLGSS